MRLLGELPVADLRVKEEPLQALVARQKTNSLSAVMERFYAEQRLRREEDLLLLAKQKEDRLRNERRIKRRFEALRKDCGHKG